MAERCPGDRNGKKTGSARPIGDAGVSRISSAAGRNCRAVSTRCLGKLSNRRFCSALLANGMDSCLELVKHFVAAGPFDQFVMLSVLDQAAGLDGNDPIGMPHSRKPVGDDKDGPAGADLAHVALLSLS